jgi:hypothetical protein
MRTVFSPRRHEAHEASLRDSEKRDDDGLAANNAGWRLTRKKIRNSSQLARSGRILSSSGVGSRAGAELVMTVAAVAMTA